MFDLDRFKAAQDRDGIYEVALKEIKAGKKKSHWIWFIFPQIKGLGRSYMSILYSISSLVEAKAYLEDDLLSERLRECTRALLKMDCKIEDAFGVLDAQKVCSCMTLFDVVSPSDVFNEVLECHFDGAKCQSTLQLISFELK